MYENIYFIYEIYFSHVEVEFYTRFIFCHLQGKWIVFPVGKRHARKIKNSYMKVPFHILSSLFICESIISNMKFFISFVKIGSFHVWKSYFIHEILCEIFVRRRAVFASSLNLRNALFWTKFTGLLYKDYYIKSFWRNVGIMYNYLSH